MTQNNPNNLHSTDGVVPVLPIDLHMDVIRLIRLEVERLATLSNGKDDTPKIPQLVMHICRFVDQCIGTGKLTQENQVKALSYNVPFWTQALLKDTKTRLQLDDWTQAIYPVNTSRFPLIPLTHNPLLNRIIGLVPESLIWKYILKNYSEVQGQYDALLFEMRERDLKKVLFVGNHATWLNHPLSAYFLTSGESEAPTIDSQELITIVGPAIMTTLLTRIGSTLRSVVLKTWPDTLRGNTSFPSKKRVRASFGQALEVIGKKETVHFLLSPSGTTDEYKDGKLHIAKPSKGSMELIQWFKEAGFTVIIIGTNDLEVMEGNAKIKPGNAHVRWKICEPTDDIMGELANCVVDGGNNQIGKYSM